MNKKEILREQATKKNLRDSAPRIFPHRPCPANYRWNVTHPQHGTVSVLGSVQYDVVIAAAKKWHVPWTAIARDCVFEKLERVAADGQT
ncbi:hypothetical protein [Faecalispora jeddahensis]|uniref:hypothetical protein n=1 Tax=Faecalispora jeddahensis TaxID=1414721 RepID=UPI00189C390D|nr:hypothetical protein [Faecalispora jeddahensis]